VREIPRRWFAALVLALADVYTEHLPVAVGGDSGGDHHSGEMIRWLILALMEVASIYTSGIGEVIEPPTAEHGDFFV